MTFAVSCLQWNVRDIKYRGMVAATYIISKAESSW